MIFLKLRKCRRRTLEESGDCNILGSNKSRQRPHESYMEISLMDRTPSRSSVCPSVPGQPPSASCSLSFRQALTTCELRNPKYEVRRWHTSDHSGGRRGVRDYRGVSFLLGHLRRVNSRSTVQLCLTQMSLICVSLQDCLTRWIRPTSSFCLDSKVDATITKL